MQIFSGSLASSGFEAYHQESIEKGVGCQSESPP